MTQLIASYELAIGCESTATSSLLPGPASGFFLGVHHANNSSEVDWLSNYADSPPWHYCILRCISDAICRWQLVSLPIWRTGLQILHRNSRHLQRGQRCKVIPLSGSSPHLWCWALSSHFFTNRKVCNGCF